MSKLLLCSRILTLITPMLIFSASEQNLGYLSTEKPHPLTMSLSQTMHQDCIQGLKILQQIDHSVLVGLQEFRDKYLADLTNLVQTIYAKKGRCLLVGSGSSGRIAIDVAARCPKDHNIIGVIAGGDSAFIRAREGFEDSEQSGMNTMQNYQVSANDLVVLISASGSATFNVGCAKYANQVGATICYFYNSRELPTRTQQLFNQLNVIPIMIDIGPQAITGSTRLQAASLARLALGVLFTQTEPEEIIAGLAFSNNLIANNLTAVAQIIELEHAVFASHNSNFRKIKDETNQGYVSFIGDQFTLRDIIMDSVETAPTFSTNPPRMTHEIGKKQAEFQGYLIDSHDNKLAWEKLIGRTINLADYDYTQQFEITNRALLKRLGHGNLLIGVAWDDPTAILKSLAQAQQMGSKTALILVSQHAISNRTFPNCDAILILDNLPNDHANLIAAITLKKTLNMISNGTMILMNKVNGNQMIDMKASNNKLVDRAIRFTQDILINLHHPANHDYKTIEACMQQILKHKQSYEEQNIYTPAPVKIAVTMLYKNVNFEQAIKLLHAHQENLEQIFNLED